MGFGYIADLLNLKSKIYIKSAKRTNSINYSDQFKKKLESLYESFYFNNLKSEGKTVIYTKIKKTYRYKKYLNFFVNNQLRKKYHSPKNVVSLSPNWILTEKGDP